MADTKISALTQLAAADPAADLIPIVDVSDSTMAASGTPKRVLPNNLFGALAANVVFAGPPSGGSAAPTWRALAAADVPSLAASKITTGQLALARGGTGADLSATGGAGQVLKQTTAGGAIGVAAITAADLPTTGLTIGSYSTPFSTATDGSTVTFNLGTSSDWRVVLGGDRALALSGATASSRFTIILEQDGTGGRSVSWFSGITWVTEGNIAPTLTATPGKRDVFTFITLSSGVYLGFVAGQSF